VSPTAVFRRRLALAGLVVLVLAGASQFATGGVFGLFSSTTGNAANNFSASTCFQPIPVSISNFVFTPASVTIAAGCRVTWTQTSSTKHTTTSNTAIWDSGQLSQNQTFTVLFNSSGTFAYRCTIHAQMTATVIVS
jgi:plastocyanin